MLCSKRKVVADLRRIQSSWSAVAPGQDAPEENDVRSADVNCDSVSFNNRPIGRERAQPPGVLVVKSREEQLLFMFLQFSEPA